jgi:hypothetical protein
MRWYACIEATAMTREAALETLELGYEDAVKNDYEGANRGPTIWGNMSRQAGIVIEERDLMTAPSVGLPRERMRLEKERDHHAAEVERLNAILASEPRDIA